MKIDISYILEFDNETCITSQVITRHHKLRSMYDLGVLVHEDIQSIMDSLSPSRISEVKVIFRKLIK